VSRGDPALGRLADAILIPPFPGRAAPGWVLTALGEGLAGVTVFGPNIGGPGQLAALTGRLRSAAAEPLIATDEEGGDVTRIGHAGGSRYPGNAALGAVDDTGLTRAVYHALGTDLAALGINVDLAPSADVNTAADNPVIGTRSFGSDPELVARHAAAAVTGLQSAGVAACAKHFPGHGSTRTDTHDTVALVDAELAVLEQRDLPPFAAAIAAGARAVMPGHLRVPGLTGDLPASLSAAALTGLLRGDLGFTGVIISDALEMRAVSGPFGLPEAAVRAVAAGTDLLCLGRDQDLLSYLAVRDALVAAVASGRLPGARLEEAAARVASLRAWTAAAPRSAAAPGPPPDPAGLPPEGAGLPVTTGPPAAAPRATAGPPTPAPGLPPANLPPATSGRPTTAPGHPPAGEVDSSQASTDLGLAAARRAVRVSGSPALPLHEPVVVEVEPPASIAVGPVPWGLASWVAAGSIIRVGTSASAADLAAAADGALTAAAGRSLVVVVRDAHRHPAARALVTTLVAARPDTVVVEMGLPLWRTPGAGYLATYGAGRSSGQAVAEVLGLAAAPTAIPRPAAPGPAATPTAPTHRHTDRPG
jgi:beta-N-acetylhexosaminidase